MVAPGYVLPQMAQTHTLPEAAEVQEVLELTEQIQTALVPHAQMVVLVYKILFLVQPTIGQAVAAVP
jgi:hypothetical protein